MNVKHGNRWWGFGNVSTGSGKSGIGVNKSLEAMNREREKRATNRNRRHKTRDNGWAVWWVLLVMSYRDYQNDPMRATTVFLSIFSFLFLLFIYF